MYVSLRTIIWPFICVNFCAGRPIPWYKNGCAVSGPRNKKTKTTMKKKEKENYRIERTKLK